MPSKWIYYKIEPSFHHSDNKYNNINYGFVYTKLKDDGIPLVIIPGFSTSSLCWTLGRINNFIINEL